MSSHASFAKWTIVTRITHVTKASRMCAKLDGVFDRVQPAHFDARSKPVFGTVSADGGVGIEPSEFCNESKHLETGGVLSIVQRGVLHALA
jgi:hypothetical protein